MITAKGIKGLDAIIAGAADNPAALAAAARLLISHDDEAQAVELAIRARQLAPDDPQIHAITQEVLSANVPGWHFVLIRDHHRNQAYEDALRRAITPGCRVLEIGTGTGILAMMAARLGAGHVYSCEMNPAVAAIARQIIARNGYADRVTVIARNSMEIDAAELGGPVDILVSEIVSNDLLNEDVLPVMEDAVGRLVRPHGHIIPARAQVRVALGDYALLDKHFMQQASGFDLSDFNALAKPSLTIPRESPALTLRSDAVDLFAFDFTTGGPWKATLGTAHCTSSGGAANGIAQWIAFDLDDAGRYENMPDQREPSCWAVMFHPFARTRDYATHAAATICGRHDRRGLRLWPG